MFVYITDRDASHGGSLMYVPWWKRPRSFRSVPGTSAWFGPCRSLTWSPWLGSKFAHSCQHLSSTCRASQQSRPGDHEQTLLQEKIMKTLTYIYSGGSKNLERGSRSSGARSEPENVATTLTCSHSAQGDGYFVHMAHEYLRVTCDDKINFNYLIFTHA